jgi:hypothetical protein
MHIEVSTDNNTAGSDILIARIKELVQHALVRVGDRITRVEVHLSDVNSGKNGQDDKVCKIEARLEGRQPTVVTYAAATLDKAARGAADKMKRSLVSTLGRLRDR